MTAANAKGTSRRNRRHCQLLNHSHGSWRVIHIIRIRGPESFLGIESLYKCGKPSYGTSPQSLEPPIIYIVPQKLIYSSGPQQFSGPDWKKIYVRALSICFRRDGVGSGSLLRRFSTNQIACLGLRGLLRTFWQTRQIRTIRGSLMRVMRVLKAAQEQPTGRAVPLIAEGRFRLISPVNNE